MQHETFNFLNNFLKPQPAYVISVLNLIELHTCETQIVLTRPQNMITDWWNLLEHMFIYQTCKWGYTEQRSKKKKEKDSGKILWKFTCAAHFADLLRTLSKNIPFLLSITREDRKLRIWLRPRRCLLIGGEI
jgi:hypothetical protein